MKKYISKTLIAAVILSFSACEKGSDNKEVVAAPAGVPQGRINSANDASNYCDIGPNSVSCFEWGRQCPQISFTDLPTLCQNIQSSLYSMNTCGQSALNAVLAQRCNGVATNQPGLPGFPQNPIGQQPLNPDFREVQCEFEAVRLSQKKILGFRTNYKVDTGLIKTSLIVDVRHKQEFDLRNHFLGFNIGQFGQTKLIFNPANLNGTADTFSLLNRGLNNEIEIKQSGFAGNVVRLEAQDDSGNMKLVVACKGLGQFKRIASIKSVTQYSCTGKSDLGTGTEDIDTILPYNTTLSGTETELAENLSMAIQGDRVQFTANGIGDEITVQTSAFLKEKVQLTIKDLWNDVSVTCSPK